MLPSTVEECLKQCGIIHEEFVKLRHYARKLDNEPRIDVIHTAHELEDKIGDIIALLRQYQ